MESAMAPRTSVKRENEPEEYNEKTPLISTLEARPDNFKSRSIWDLPGRATGYCVRSIKVVITVATAPARYVITYFYDDDGHFSALMPVYHITRSLARKRRKGPRDGDGSSSEKNRGGQKSNDKARTRKSYKRNSSLTSASSSSAIMSSDSELDTDHGKGTLDSPASRTRSRSSMASSSGDEIAPSKRSIRIKLHNDGTKQRKTKAAVPSPVKEDPAAEQSPDEAAAAALKSPSGPAMTGKTTKFPRAPQPPRPLVPRRQASYSANVPSAFGPHQKTLIIDLDETLIHSMSKGGRYTTGHMVEVKLQQPMAAAGTVLTPQVPILYYVHKRPHCDEFLRKVSKWYNLVVFTASVQEYADPVIDWLELERKYFSGRYYRQHCTYRNGSYIKDLSQVEADLSKVMILDNSPMSYVFHEDNAIPIEGWIIDPTDNELLHLIPFLEGLQHVTDVRALLALRRGEPQSA